MLRKRSAVELKVTPKYNHHLSSQLEKKIIAYEPFHNHDQPPQPHMLHKE